MRFWWRVWAVCMVWLPWIGWFYCYLMHTDKQIALSVSLSRTRLPPVNQSVVRAVLDKVQAADTRPRLVRFRWYVPGTSPVHVGYGGLSAMEIFKAFGFEETDSDEWDLLWTMVPQWDNMASGKSTAGQPFKLRPWQIHNHCLALHANQGMAGAKDSQWMHFKRLLKRYGEKAFHFMPQTYILPDDRRALERVLQSTDANQQPWIIKPIIGKRAIGVAILTKKEDLPYPTDTRRYVVQRYITNPLLVRGRKFHLRLYLIISSLNPFRVLMHREGLVLFAAHNYSASPATYKNSTIHLTNAAVADRSQMQKQVNGWLLSELWEHLEVQLGPNRLHSVQDKVDDALMKLALASQLSGGGFEERVSGSCFEFLGIDVLIDSTLDVHVMEVNVGPEVYSAEPKTHRANDLAHKALLNDMIPLLAMKRPHNQQLSKKFSERLDHFMAVHRLSLCPENVFFPVGSKSCLTKNDISALWKLFDEDEHLGNFKRLYPVGKTATTYNAFFVGGLDPLNRWATMWAKTTSS